MLLNRQHLFWDCIQRTWQALNGTPAGQPPSQLHSDSVRNTDNIIHLIPQDHLVQLGFIRWCHSRKTCEKMLFLPMPALYSKGSNYASLHVTVLYCWTKQPTIWMCCQENPRGFPQSATDITVNPAWKLESLAWGRCYCRQRSSAERNAKGSYSEEHVISWCFDISGWQTGGKEEFVWSGKYWSFSSGDNKYPPLN